MAKPQRSQGAKLRSKPCRVQRVLRGNELSAKSPCKKGISTTSNATGLQSTTVAQITLKPGKFPLLSLPLELRDLALETALVSKHEITPKYWSISRERVFGVLFSCRQLYNEELIIFPRVNSMLCYIKYPEEWAETLTYVATRSKFLASVSPTVAPKNLPIPRGIPPRCWRSMITKLELRMAVSTLPFRLRNCQAYFAPLRILQREGFYQWDPKMRTGLQSIVFRYNCGDDLSKERRREDIWSCSACATSIESSSLGLFGKVVVTVKDHGLFSKGALQLQLEEALSI